MLFLAIVFGLVFGSQAYNAIKLFIFPDFRAFYNLKFGLWMMCVLFDAFIIYKLFFLIFVIGGIHLIFFVCFANHGRNNDYLSTPLHPDIKQKEK